ncbi:MAG: flippase-like domain-containing protein [Dethiobacter sp.]|jgi:uncharacterized protein (TIRG00374 family)|nr:flippase-like domain-containing protein [Dethiobacter sp.]
MLKFSPKKIIAGIVSAVTLSVVTIYFLMRYYGLKTSMSELLASIPYTYMLLILIILFTAWLADACRLREISGAFGTPIPLKLAVYATLAGNFSINVTPFFMGAGIVHVYVLKRKGLELSTATAAVAGGAMISHVTQGVLALISLFFTRGWIVSESIPASKPLALVILTYLLIILVVGSVFFFVDEPRRTLGFLFRIKRFEKLSNKFCEFHKGLNLLLRGDPRRLLRILFFNSIYLVCFYAVTPIILFGLGSPQPLGHVIAFQLLLFFTASLAPTPGSSGAIELGAFSLFALIVPLAVLGKFLVWWRLATFFSNIAFGALPFAYLALSKKWHTQRQPKTSEEHLLVGPTLQGEHY